ncbi:hypothetical protein WICPIJ_005950 [Wickerhamomyces pijperi]|uniref:Uncharacterized protein n=1 Tax=Wickerhamomyces pijperi TaxID=599730 RepID=A0A9P8Q336_WICPI|nr:hypothetical protein WICPIJ_005950 [Wickerhamomyces pijperi]
MSNSGSKAVAVAGTGESVAESVAAAAAASPVKVDVFLLRCLEAEMISSSSLFLNLDPSILDMLLFLSPVKLPLDSVFKVFFTESKIFRLEGFNPSGIVSGN